MTYLVKQLSFTRYQSDRYISLAKIGVVNVAKMKTHTYCVKSHIHNLKNFVY